MSLFRKSLMAGAAVAALTSGVAAHAGVVVDLFTDPAGGQIVDTSPFTDPAIGNTSIAGSYSSIIGGYRNLGITQNAGDAFQYAKATVFNGTLSVANDPTVKSTTVVTWNGNNAVNAAGSNVTTTGLGGIDLTAGNASFFQALVKYADLGFNYHIKVWDMDGDWSVLSAGVQFAVPEGNTDVAKYLFSWFNLADGTYCDGVASPPACADPLTQLDFSILKSSAGAVIDFTKVGALQLVLDNPTVTSVDFQLGSVETVPEPGALALAGLGLVGVAAVGARRRKISKS